MQISKYTTLDDATYSETALRKGIDNKPDDIQLTAMKYLAVNGYDRCVEFVGGKLDYNSWFRSQKLNKAIGGAVNSKGISVSQHCNGEAVDLDCDKFGGKTNRELFDWISTNLDFDQLIAEVPDGKGNYAWIHLSMVDPKLGKKNRKQRLIAIPKQAPKKGWDYTTFTKHII